jgi:hypothetical protein
MLRICRETDYRAKIRTWGAVDASWKKNRNSKDNDSIETMLRRHAHLGDEVELYKWGKLAPQKEVTRFRNQNHVSLHKLHDPNCMSNHPFK